VIPVLAILPFAFRFVLRSHLYAMERVGCVMTVASVVVVGAAHCRRFVAVAMRQRRDHAGVAHAAEAWEQPMVPLRLFGAMAVLGALGVSTWAYGAHARLGAGLDAFRAAGLVAGPAVIWATVAISWRMERRGWERWNRRGSTPSAPAATAGAQR
jgi:hypothetical protein